MMGILFGARPIYMVATDQFSVYGIDMRPQFTSVALMGLVSTLAFIVGTAAGTSRQPRGDRERVLTSRGVLPAVLLALLGLALFGMNILRQGGNSGEPRHSGRRQVHSLYRLFLGFLGVPVGRACAARRGGDRDRGGDPWTSSTR